MIFFMKSVDLKKQELEWQVDEDVRTLERYAEILNDASRLARAKKAAKEKAKQLEERAEALKSSAK